ncbi:hypothetical protein [Devosia sp. Leaf420]|uniref:hypothetical protein n=1 Tax=Devosia sp. Leaf420 TaxID=1736374 RepID=UPI0012E88E14|nr:hypothetical protein [Devosia sp. Leaf420]
MPKVELIAGALFFALAGATTVMLRQPLDAVGWVVLVACVAFVALAVFGMVKPAGFARGMPSRTPGRPTTEFEIGRRDDMAPAGDPTASLAMGMPSGTSREPPVEPTTSELQVLAATIAALEAVDGLSPGEVDAMSLWNAMQEIDPGQAIGLYEAIGSFSMLHDLGRTRIGRMTFVPAHTEYDASLLAEITASVLTSLGHPMRSEDIVVTLPADGGQGTANIAFPIAGRIETIECSYLWKYPPDDLCANLKRFSRNDDPRQLVCADPGDQTLLYVAIREGSIGELNELLPAEIDQFYEA